MWRGSKAGEWDTWKGFMSVPSFASRESPQNYFEHLEAGRERRSALGLPAIARDGLLSIAAFRNGTVEISDLLHQPPGCIRPHYRDGEQHGVDAVEHTSVAGEDGAGIFYSGAALDQGLD
jgi:hypothetical protein